MEKHLRNFSNFIKNLSSNDRIAFILDSDADGISSGVIAFKAIQRIARLKPKLILIPMLRQGFISNEFLKKMKKNKINKLLTFDVSIDSLPKMVKKAEKFLEILIIDHHKVYNDVSSKKTVLIKSCFLSKIEPSQYPTSKLTFDLFSRFTDLNDLDWVCTVGITADSSTKTWKKFVKKVEKKYSFTEFEKLVELVTAVEIIKFNGLKNLFKEFLNAKKPQELLKSNYLKLVKQLKNELNYWIENFSEKAEFFEKQDLVFYYITPKFPIKSPLINFLSHNFFPNKTVIIVQELKNQKFLSFSGRRQDLKIKVNELFEKCIKGFKEAIAGGHIPAAGGKIRKKDFKKFKKRILKELVKK
jgi:single-stranded DNA-specific DHH superfamily exonuclease